MGLECVRQLVCMPVPYSTQVKRSLMEAGFLVLQNSYIHLYICLHVALVVYWIPDIFFITYHKHTLKKKVYSLFLNRRIIPFFNCTIFFFFFGFLL